MALGASTRDKIHLLHRKTLHFIGVAPGPRNRVRAIIGKNCEHVPSGFPLGQSPESHQRGLPGRPIYADVASLRTVLRRRGISFRTGEGLAVDS